jgi:signal peptidase I
LKILKNQQSSIAPSKEKSRFRENVEAILLAIILAMFIRTFVVQAFKIPSGSMKQTLLIGDHILVNKFIYGVKLPFTGITLIPVREPKRGDIVVFKFPEDPGKDFIKRVVGVEGDVVEIRDKQVFVNGKPENHSHGVHMDPYTIPPGVQPRDYFGPVTVPPDSIFVLGDNRDHSYDSRFWGFVELKDMKGKAFIIYWSWNNQDFGVRWGRIGKLLE